MSSKFFTWGHKGDKKSSPYGVVPIPAECITIHGIDSKGPSKARRKPLPLDLYQMPDATSNERNRTDDSIALHDAAVQSATSLLAVINDCLKSPPLNAHFMSNQNQQAGLQPMHGRPRSRTAPSTPMNEAPVAKQMSPVELPGSMPVVKRGHAAHQSMDSRALRSIMVAPVDSTSLGKSIERPHSSPQESTHKLPVYSRQSSDNFSRSAIGLQPPMDPLPRAKTGSPCRRSRSIKPDAFNTSDDTLVGSENGSSPLRMKRPLLSTLSGFQSSSTGSLPCDKSVQPDGTTATPQLPPAATSSISQGQSRKQASSHEGVLMGQIAAMRAAHDAHLQALKEAHEKELTSHRSYASFLEQRIAALGSERELIKHNLTIDTSQLPNKDLSVLSSEASATNSMQSFETTLENQKRASSEAVAEAQKLRRDRDHHKDLAERNERRISQLRGIVRKAKENETALKNAISGFEASLLAANNERLDVLEGYHEACEQLRILGKERDEYRNRLGNTGSHSREDNVTDGTPPGQKSLYESVPRSHSLRHNKLLQQLDEVRQTLSERNLHIKELEQQVARVRGTDSTESGVNTAVEERLEVCEQQLTNALLDRERYDTLLHTELRRQSRAAAQKAHTATPKLETQALAAMRDRLNALKDISQTADNLDGKVEVEPSILELELQHCFKEIIMYKLDVKGYKKDLRSANAEIETLQAQLKEQSRSSNEAIRRRSESRIIPTSNTPGTESNHEPSSGLGIVMPSIPSTPQRTAVPATASGLLSPARTPAHAPNAPSPSYRPKTPLGVHKKLPKPPPQSRTPSPYPQYSPPRVEVQRQETMRSLSESIISSYAKRSTPEQRAEDMASPPRGRSSDPPRMSIPSGEDAEGSDAKVVSMAKFTPRMLRTAARIGAAAAAAN